MTHTIGNITEATITQICLDTMFSDNGSELEQILTDVEFWEGGSVQIEEDGNIRIWGDNGVKDVSIWTVLNCEMKSN